VIVAPTEPPKLRAVADRVNLWPETMGADIAWVQNGKKIGVQRKELRDLIASLADGRLGQQLVMMNALDIGVLLIEGKPRFSMDGELINGSGFGVPFTFSQWLGVKWTAQLMGVWVDHTDDLDGTIQWLQSFKRWTAKPRHNSLIKREKVSGSWGSADSADFARHILMGFPGVGVEVATRIVARYGLPLEWTVGVDDLMEVEGIGKVKAKKLVGMLDGGKLK